MPHFLFGIFIRVKKLLYIAFFLCISLSKLCCQSFVSSIEHGVYIDHRLTYPYTQVVLTTTSGFYVEAGMLDLPGDINLRFNNTVQQRAGDLAYLINTIEEPVGHRGSSNHRSYYSVGYMTTHKRYRQGIQIGRGTGGNILKLSQYYRAIDVEGGFLDVGLHFQTEGRIHFMFFGYSWGLNFN